MKDKVKKALKRGASGLLAVLLAVCLVGTPRAKAVVSEGALLGSIFGSLLVSMGYSWAADNMDVPTFGESIYKLTQEFDEAMKDTGNQLIRDLNLAGLTANGAGKLQFGYAWVQAARSFAEWFEEKFFTSDSSSSIVSETFSYLILDDGSYFILSDWPSGNSPSTMGTKFYPNDTVTFSDGSYISTTDSELTFYNAVTQSIDYTTSDRANVEYYFLIAPKYKNWISIGFYRDSSFWTLGATIANYDVGSITKDLSAEKPQEVHYPDVAEDGSQVYEITVDGVTATDIEGIIQGAVDRILAGTAAIAGSIADSQAKPGEEVVNPEIEPYKVGLSSVFPFCIPFDVYNMVTMFVAEPEAPHAEWTFTLPWGSQEYSVGWDLAAFDGVARVCRDMELVLFAVGLAVITYKVIKW